MWATWMKDPAWGPEIMDLSILPPLETFLFFSALGLARDPELESCRRRWMGERVHTYFAVFLRIDFLP